MVAAIHGGCYPSRVAADSVSATYAIASWLRLRRYGATHLAICLDSNV